MNHLKIYESIINNAKSENRVKLRKNQKKFIYYENHHILPRCLGGNNEKENLVLLTAREHFICHKLLTYINPKNRKITLAFFRLSYDNHNRKISSRDYTYAKKLMSLNGHNKKTKIKISTSLKGKKHSIERRLKQSVNYKSKGINKGPKNPMYKKDPWNKGKTGVYSRKLYKK